MIASSYIEFLTISVGFAQAGVSAGAMAAMAKINARATLRLPFGAMRKPEPRGCSVAGLVVETHAFSPSVGFLDHQCLVRDKAVAELARIQMDFRSLA